MNQRTIVRFAARDWRIKFQGKSPAYWYFSDSFSTQSDAQAALATIDAHSASTNYGAW